MNRIRFAVLIRVRYGVTLSLKSRIEYSIVKNVVTVQCDNVMTQGRPEGGTPSKKWRGPAWALYLKERREKRKK